MEIAQGLLDHYEAGVIITAINLGDVQPPEEVADAFDDVVRAEQNKKQLKTRPSNIATSAISRPRARRPN